MTFCIGVLLSFAWSVALENYQFQVPESTSSNSPVVLENDTHFLPSITGCKVEQEESLSTNWNNTRHYLLDYTRIVVGCMVFVKGMYL